LPLFKLLTKEVGFYWSKECQHAFDVVKEKNSSAPMLRRMNGSLLFHIYTNVSHSSIGEVMGKKENSLTHVVYFLRKNIAHVELNYTVTEKEFFAVVYAINKFRHYITRYNSFIHTDHSAIRYLMNREITNGIITRWLLLLQEFNITILDRPGKENQVDDFLSRLNNEGENTHVDDSFPDENFLSISTNSTWFADIANYRVIGKLSPQFSLKERKRVVRLSALYSWIK
jgi:hypothetical protein